jgi:hypothetical protein
MIREMLTQAARDIHNIRCYLADLFEVGPMTHSSVNGWVYVPLSFVIIIYCAVIIITTVSIVYFLTKKNPFAEALRKSIFTAFFCTGFLYLVHSERTWFKWFSHDVSSYSGLSTEEKSAIDFRSIYAYAMVAQRVLKESEYTMYSSDSAVSLVAQYYLLPRRNRTNTKNILVFYDSSASYDDNTKTFSRGDMRVENAEMLFRYNISAYILRAK